MSELLDADEDLEIKAMRDVFSALKGLDADAQARVMNYVDQRLGLKRSRQTVTPDVKDSRRQSEEEIVEVRATDEMEVEDTDPVAATPSDEDSALEGVSPVAKKWMRRNGLTEAQLSSLYSLGVDEIDLVAKAVPGASAKERLRSVLLLQGIAAYLSSGVPRIENDRLKEATKHYDADVGGNFVRELKACASEVAGSRSEANLTLTTRGLNSAKDLIKSMTQE